MPYLFQIGFDNSVRLSGRVHYFEYGGYRFKLIQNDPRKWCDVLLTILPSFGDADEQGAYTAAGEWAAALNWELDFSMAVRPIGGFGVDDGFRLRNARCQVFTFPEVPFKGQHSGYHLNRIALVATDEQRTAVTLYREAQSANKEVLSLLFNWQVMDVRPAPAQEPEVWVNTIEAAAPAELARVWELVSELGLGGRPLGDYLREDCRHAIAHLRRRPGRHVIRFDDSAEAWRIRTAARVTRKLARHFVASELSLNQHLYLVRPLKGGSPDTWIDRRSSPARIGWCVHGSSHSSTRSDTPRGRDQDTRRDPRLPITKRFPLAPVLRTVAALRGTRSL